MTIEHRLNFWRCLGLMRPLVLELSPTGQFGNATIHAVFGGPFFATSPGENLEATPCILRVHSRRGFVSIISVELPARSGDLTSMSMSCTWRT